MGLWLCRFYYTRGWNEDEVFVAQRWLQARTEREAYAISGDMIDSVVPGGRGFLNWRVYPLDVSDATERNVIPRASEQDGPDESPDTRFDQN